MSRSTRSLSLFLGAIGLFTLASSGCSKPDEGLDTDQQKMATRLDEIGKKSGYDWNKVSAEDKQFMIQKVGSEKNAQMMLLAKSGNLHGNPGGPRR